MQHCKFLICLTSLVTNYSLVIDFVAYRSTVKPLDSIIIFKTNKFASDGVIQELHQRLHIPQVIVKNVATPNVQEIMNKKSIALIFMEKLDKSRTWSLVAESLHRHYFIPMVFLSQTVPRLDVQLRFFHYFRQLNMLNTIVMFPVNNTMAVRTTIAYPKMQIIAVDPRNFSGFAWQKERNVYGYKFHLSYFNDPPILYKQVANNRTELRGLIRHVLDLFMKRVNGTYTTLDYPMSKSTEDNLDFTANLVLRTDLINPAMEPSYPILQPKACVMVPIESSIPLSWYILYPFDILTWQLLGYHMLIILILVIAIQCIYNRNRDLMLHILFVLKLFLAHPVSLPGIRGVTRGVFLIYFGGLFLVIVNVYEGSLTSLFSARVRMPAVRTPEDLLKTDLMIAVTEIERQLYFVAKLLPESLMSRVFNIGKGTSAIENMNGNISFAYVITSDKWLWYEKRQKHLQLPVFRITSGNLCTPNIPQYFALKKHLPFKRMLQMVMMELQESGLVNYWLANVKPAAKFQLSDETVMTQLPLSLAHFTLGFYILFVGWLLAVVAFVGEWIIWRRQEIYGSRIILRLRKAWRRKQQDLMTRTKRMMERMEI
ncbi:uncharacterized protein LOC126755854 [Bactrocera neohumeralis]|uniref:uncharacterized protein LOC126755854 n=1 Tax=Bactrocera neohumeralis TaxID=98809 RepID=UPI002166A8F1|nr:uncharacterized protein LOC126755854 [Bactrocera neohumeralis]